MAVNWGGHRRTCRKLCRLLYDLYGILGCSTIVLPFAIFYNHDVMYFCVADEAPEPWNPWICISCESHWKPLKALQFIFLLGVLFPLARAIREPRTATWNNVNDVHMMCKSGLEIAGALPFLQTGRWCTFPSWPCILSMWYWSVRAPDMTWYDCMMQLTLSTEPWWIMRPMNDVTPEASKNYASSAAAKRRFAQQYPKFILF